MEMSIRPFAMHPVLLVDQHPVACAGLAALIDRCDDFEICAIASTRNACFRCMQTATPDIIVMDIAINDIDGIELIRHFARMLPQAPILVFSALDEREYAPRAFTAGARGFLPKTATAEQLLGAMRDILAGNPVFPFSPTGDMPLEIAPDRECALSDRELELFRFLGKGFTTQKIAAVMQLSEHTVNAYRLQIKKKLGLDDFSKLVQQAVLWEDHQH